MTVYLNPTPEMKAVVTRAFPSYKGNKYQVRITNKYLMQNYWDGGSKHDCVLVRRENLEILPSHSATEDPTRAVAHGEIEIPKNHFIVERAIVRGKEFGITFFIRSDEADTGMLPIEPSDDLTDHEKIVLIASNSLKSSYAGIKNYRLYSASVQTGITSSEYENAKQSLIKKSLLNKAGAVTITGKNLYSLLPADLYQLSSSLKEKESKKVTFVDESVEVTLEPGMAVSFHYHYPNPSLAPIESVGIIESVDVNKSGDYVLEVRPTPAYQHGHCLVPAVDQTTLVISDRNVTATNIDLSDDSIHQMNFMEMENNFTVALPDSSDIVNDVSNNINIESKQTKEVLRGKIPPQTLRPNTETTMANLTAETITTASYNELKDAAKNLGLKYVGIKADNLRTNIRVELEKKFNLYAELTGQCTELTCDVLNGQHTELTCDVLNGQYSDINAPVTTPQFLVGVNPSQTKRFSAAEDAIAYANKIKADYMSSQKIQIWNELAEIFHTVKGTKDKKKVEKVSKNDDKLFDGLSKDLKRWTEPEAKKTTDTKTISGRKKEWKDIPPASVVKPCKEGSVMAKIVELLTKGSTDEEFAAAGIGIGKKDVNNGLSHFAPYINKHKGVGVKFDGKKYSIWLP